MGGGGSAATQTAILPVPPFYLPPLLPTFRILSTISTRSLAFPCFPSSPSILRSPARNDWQKVGGMKLGRRRGDASHVRGKHYFSCRSLPQPSSGWGAQSRQGVGMSPPSLFTALKTRTAGVRARRPPRWMPHAVQLAVLGHGAPSPCKVRQSPRR